MKTAENIDKKTLKDSGLIKDENRPVKILGKIDKDFSVAAKFFVDKVSNSAKKMIEKSGGTIEGVKLAKFSEKNVEATKKEKRKNA